MGSAQLKHRKQCKHSQACSSMAERLMGFLADRHGHLRIRVNSPSSVTSPPEFSCSRSPSASDSPLAGRKRSGGSQASKSVRLLRRGMPQTQRPTQAFESLRFGPFINHHPLHLRVWRAGGREGGREGEGEEGREGGRERERECD